MKFKMGQRVRVKEDIDIRPYLIGAHGLDSGYVNMLINNIIEINNVMDHDIYGPIYRFSIHGYEVWVQEPALRALKKAVAAKDRPVLTEVQALDKIAENFREG